MCDKGTKPGFWNLDAVLAGPCETIFITEGELDAAALVESGLPIDSVLSVPAGAKKLNDKDPDRGFGYVQDAIAAGLKRIKRFVLCVDADDPGCDLREALAYVLGKARVSFVNWPEGCKDANEMLLANGPGALHDLVEYGAVPWPVSIYRMSGIPEPGPIKTWDPGFPEWESRIRVAPSMLSVVTGYPGHGKSQFFTQLWFQVAKAYDLQVFVVSFETRPKPHMRRQLRSLHAGVLERDMMSQQITTADEWIEEHYLFGSPEGDQSPTLEWFLNLAECAVIRYGAKVVLLDPWNRLEACRAPGDRKPTTSAAVSVRCMIFHKL